MPTTTGAPGNAAQIVLAFGSLAAINASNALEKLRSLYPKANVCGCTTSGEIQGARVYDETVAVTAITFEHTSVRAIQVAVDGPDKSCEAGEDIAGALYGAGLRHVFLLSDGLLVNGCDLLRGINGLLPEGVTVSGGFAGDGNRIKSTHVWCDGPPVQSTVVALGLYGERLRVGIAATAGWDAFGLDRLVTRSKSNVVYEFDGRPALALYKQYLGEHAEGLPATGLMYPIQLRVGGEEDRVLRTLLAIDEKEQSLIFAGNVPERSFARMMIGNVEHLIDAAEDAVDASVKDLGVDHAQLAILVSCNGRRPVLKQRTEEELETVAETLGDTTPITGFYSYGEIAPVGGRPGAEMHNQTLSVVTFAEA